ncbi:conjugal transfer protein MobC [Chitinophaga sp. Ak27]|uniref:conjugal transfer protein MobC n=1 Tax=Chitinophaga sp. Ak27 TaxID=2726116 RepID=UPI00145E7363|nr:conjugal transfer protein MobC [Chitinophaga sp. Ak27]NLU94899.1 type IV secretion system DNA-binding domain-containing protein [Chitinophaga sp. Ak27]
MAHTGENEQALRKILDMTRLISITLLVLHIYYFFYGAFLEWHLITAFTDRLLVHISRTGLFSFFHKSKLFALCFLAISVLGTRGRKSPKLTLRKAWKYILSGLILYFCSYFLLLQPWKIVTITLFYTGITFTGYLLMLTGGTWLSRIITNQLADDIFNAESETFPQEERLLENPYSINIHAQYKYKGRIRASVLNFVANFRSTIILGSPGSGKSAYFFREFIRQSLEKKSPYVQLVYDFKFPDLSLIAYNYWLKNKHKYKAKSECIFINFDDLSRTNRGNVFDPLGMIDITDASESARTILLGLNKQWQTRQGDFFVESPINFVSAIIWFLRKYKDGKYCTLPHAIELLQVEYDNLFSILRLEETIHALINPFIQAYLNDVMEQLEGQLASAKIALARLSSPQLYYVLSGNDFSLDINNPDHPKILCLGNNPQKIQTYGAVLSLYINRLLKIINKKGKLPSMLIFDEYPTISADLTSTISTGRSSLISCVLGVQSLQQMTKEYGKEQADVITSIVGNIVSGQVTGDSAKQVSERIGKIMQDRQSHSIGQEVSFSNSKQLEYAVPASKIAMLSSGEFVGTLADLPDQKLPLKAFHCTVMADFEAINAEEKAYQPIPVIREVTPQMVNENYLRIKQEVADLVSSEIARMLNDPELEHLVIRK